MSEPASTREKAFKLSRKGNALKGHRHPDDPVLLEVERERIATTLQARIEEVVNGAPALTDAQRNRLAALLRPAGAA